MVCDCISALVLLATPVQPLIASDSLPRPNRNLIFQFEKENRDHPWLIATTPTGRFRFKAAWIDRVGLGGLSPEGASPADPLPWAQVERLDERVTHRRQGQRLGSFALGLAGAGLGNALGAPSRSGGSYAMVGYALMSTIGGVVGGHLGDGHGSERNWYIAGAAVSGAPEQLAAAPTAPELPVGTDVLRACGRIGPHDVFRASGEFGHFQGYADVAGPSGLESLRTDRQAREEWAGSPLPERISWETINEVQMRGGSALKGALGLGASFALMGALLGAAAVAVAGDGSVGVGSGAALGAAYVAPVGIVLGAGLGALVRRWVVVYRRP